MFSFFFWIKKELYIELNIVLIELVKHMFYIELIVFMELIMKIRNLRKNNGICMRMNLC